jgi:hypothetical protein
MARRGRWPAIMISEYAPMGLRGSDVVLRRAGPWSWQGERDLRGVRCSHSTILSVRILRSGAD